jgi:uncharacterized membrane protein YkgB
MKLSNLLGIVFAIPGAAIVAACVLDLHDCNTWMLITGCAMMTLGALIFDPATVANALKSLAGIAGPYVPGGGRRRDDPPDRPVG